MFISLNHFCRSSYAKFVPLSEMMRNGNPNRQIMCSQINLRITVVVVDARAFASTHLVK
ncbi:hypothetical protein HanIR_Chr07g0314891 [Helianthus annuus]|nr:hypothetical protein HanIR_Chr07g0314891 [Helianthus annuus]